MRLRHLNSRGHGNDAVDVEQLILDAGRNFMVLGHCAQASGGRPHDGEGSGAGARIDGEGMNTC